MRILIIGGSNSVMTEGYISRLKEHKGISEVINLSVGGTTSLTAVGRLLADPIGKEIDVILYEYSINDTGHFFPRSDGPSSWLLMFQLILESSARLYPNAVLIPIILSEARFYSLSAPNPIYDIQTAVFDFLQIQYIDVRKYFSQIFFGNLPKWLYKDGAHYSTPYGADLVGFYVIKKIDEFLNKNTRSTTSKEWAIFSACTAFQPLKCDFISSQSIFQKDNTFSAKNSLMSIDYGRIKNDTGIQIKLDSFPLAIYVKSDINHSVLNMEISSPGFLGTDQNINISTCHADTREHSFVFTSLPIPLYFSQTLLNIGGPSILNLIAPSSWEASTIRAFDAFFPNNIGQNYCDLAGILTVKRF